MLPFLDPLEHMFLSQGEQLSFCLELVHTLSKDFLNTYQKETQSLLSFSCLWSSPGWWYILVPLSWCHVHTLFSTVLFPRWPWIGVQCEPTLSSYSQLYGSCRRSSLYQPLCRSETRALWDFRRMHFLKGTHYYEQWLFMYFIIYLLCV